VEACVAAGGTPFFVGATCGSTVLASFDPLPEIAQVRAFWPDPSCQTGSAPAGSNTCLWQYNCAAAQNCSWCYEHLISMVVVRMHAADVSRLRGREHAEASA